MLIKLGVSIERLSPQTRRILNIVDAEYEVYGSEAVITSTYEGNHRPGSLHYQDDAIDFRRTPDINSIAKNLRVKLSDDYDVVIEVDHLHVEYDPKEVKG